MEMASWNFLRACKKGEPAVALVHVSATMRGRQGLRKRWSKVLIFCDFGKQER